MPAGDASKSAAAAAIAIDLDGTLLSSSRSPSPESLRAIAQLVDIGYAVVIATARPVRAVRSLLPEWFARFYWATCNGAWVVQDGQVLRRCEIPFSQTRALIDLVRQLGYLVQVEADDAFYSDHPLREEYVGGHLPLARYIGGAACQVLVEVASAEQAMAVAAQLPQSVSAVLTAHDTLLQITAAGCSKASAVGFILERAGVAARDLVAFGDDNNDIPLLEMAGYGVAVGNATAALRAVADFVVDTNDDNGVGSVLQEILCLDHAGGRFPLAEWAATRQRWNA